MNRQTPACNVEPRTPEAAIALLERRLARTNAARIEAEALLEQKSRVLARANDELEAHRHQLNTSLARRTRQLLDAQRVAGFGTLLWDIGARRLELSPQVRMMLGLEPTTEVHHYRALLGNLVAEDRPRMVHWLHRELLGSIRNGRGDEQSCDKDFSIEVRAHGDGKTGPVRWMRIMAQFEFNADWHPVLIYATVQDITRQVIADEEAATLRQRDERRLMDLEVLNRDLQQAREAAERANAAKSRFLAMMSHDIRTPLNGVIGMLALFDEAALNAAQRKTLSLVRSSGDQLRVLLNDIIDLARAEAGKLQLNPGPTNTVEVLREGTDFWRYMAMEKNLTLDLALAPDMPAWVEADQTRLRQLIDNLLSNAIKYTLQGGVVLRGEYLPGGRLRIAVTDTGIGIPPDRQAELFEQFRQLNLLGGEPGGAGLGLAICKRIVGVMNGTIGAHDAGGGSCFWFEIPCPAISPPQEAANPVKLSLRELVGRTPRVLVAEDLATNRIVVEGLLRKLGCDVCLVENGQLAVQAAARERFDCVLMDMAMPVMDGPQATRMIRALGHDRTQLPIIALTAYARPEELEPMMSAGANSSVAKPIVLSDLYHAMARQLAPAISALPALAHA